MNFLEIWVDTFTEEGRVKKRVGAFIERMVFKISEIF